MKTTLIAGVGLFVSAFGIAGAAQAAPQFGQERPGPHGGGSTVYTATCHYLIRSNGTTRSGASTGAGIDPGSAINSARSNVPGGAQVTGCSTTGVRH